MKDTHVVQPVSDVRSYNATHKVSIYAFHNIYDVYAEEAPAWFLWLRQFFILRTFKPANTPIVVDMYYYLFHRYGIATKRLWRDINTSQT